MLEEISIHNYDQHHTYLRTSRLFLTMFTLQKLPKRSFYDSVANRTYFGHAVLRRKDLSGSDMFAMFQGRFSCEVSRNLYPYIWIQYLARTRLVLIKRRCWFDSHPTRRVSFRSPCILRRACATSPVSQEISPAVYMKSLPRYKFSLNVEVYPHRCIACVPLYMYVYESIHWYTFAVNDCVDQDQPLIKINTVQLFHIII